MGYAVEAPWQTFPEDLARSRQGRGEDAAGLNKQLIAGVFLIMGGRRA